MKAFELIKNIVFTKRCRYCDRVIDIRKDLCPSCENNLQRICGEVCLKCGREKVLCSCDGSQLFYKSVVAPFYYEGAIHRSVWLLKFRYRTAFSRVIAEEMYPCFLKHYKEYKIDFVTFVPSHSSSIKERGFNPAELIARDFCEIANFKCSELLIKTFKTKAQHTLNRLERKGNLAGAFAIRDGVSVEDKRILLIDDVKTSGKTLNECAKTLIAGGAAEIICLAGAVTGGKTPAKEKNTLL